MTQLSTITIQAMFGFAPLLAQAGPRLVQGEHAVADRAGGPVDRRAWCSLPSSPATSGCGFSRSRPGPGIGIFDLLRMTFRKVNPTVIIAQQDHGRAGRAVRQRRDHDQGAGGPLPGRRQRAAGDSLDDRRPQGQDHRSDFKLATAIDLAGRNILEAVQTSVYPQVIDCPAKNSKRPTLDAVAKNGIQLKVKARVTVRANLDQLIGGATEETIIARVGEGIVSAIGSAETHAEVLENPDRISKAVLARRLDSQTAFEIVSIDIADIDVGDNIGARLQADQAEADTRVARAQAEGRRAMAVSQEQENIAKIEENRAKLVEAEAEVPKAMAEAFRSGRLGILDYYKLQNVQADTDMRGAIATASSPEPKVGFRVQGSGLKRLHTTLTGIDESFATIFVVGRYWRGDRQPRGAVHVGAVGD